MGRIYVVVAVTVISSVLAGAFAKSSRDSSRPHASPSQSSVNISHHSSTLRSKFVRLGEEVGKDPRGWWERHHKLVYTQIWKGFKLGFAPFIWMGATVLSGGTGAAVGGAMVAEVLQETAGKATSDSTRRNLRTAATAEPWNERLYKIHVEEAILLALFAVILVCSLLLGFFAAKALKGVKDTESMFFGGWSADCWSSSFCIAVKPTLYLPA